MSYDYDSKEYLREALKNQMKIEEDKVNEICKSCASINEFASKREEMIKTHNLSAEQQLLILEYVRLVNQGEQDGKYLNERDRIMRENGQEVDEFNYDAFYERNKERIKCPYTTWSEEEIKRIHEDALNYYYSKTAPGRLELVVSSCSSALAHILPRLAVLSKSLQFAFKGLLNSSDEIF